jgi:hypothetical protein
MTDVLSVIFDRWDRHPSMHEYGRTIDRRFDRLAGGGNQVPRGCADPRVPISGYAACFELHETGPIFLLEPDKLPSLTPVLDDVRLRCPHGTPSGRGAFRRRHQRGSRHRPVGQLRTQRTPARRPHQGACCHGILMIGEIVSLFTNLALQ